MAGEAPRSPGRRDRGRIRRLALGAALLVGVAACGDDDGSAVSEDVRGAQPAPRSTELEPGVFDQLPRFPGSEAISERSEEDGVVAQSFEVAGQLPDTILDFYETSLVGWEPLGREQLGAASERGRWRQGAMVLTVSAAEAPTLDDGPDVERPSAQYSLSLDLRAGAASEG